MLASFASASTRGRVYGFHRAMDHAGAVTGPLIASAFLFFYPGEYRTLFTLTLVPGVIVILVLLRVPDTARAERSTLKEEGVQPPGPVRPAPLPGTFYRAMAVIFIFSLGNASDAFLLLRMGDLGIAPFWIPLLWSALHVVKTVSSVVGGDLSDRVGRRTLIALGWSVYALVYGAFGLFATPAPIVITFLAYGLYFGMTEGVEKAWVADLAPSTARGTAFGIYNALLGAGGLGASLLFGAIWTRVSPPAAFFTGSALAVAATVLLYLMFPQREYYQADPGHQR
jgi:MFS family permease